MSNKKLIIIFVVLALLLLGVYGYMHFKTNDNGKEPNSPGNGPEPFPLKFGSKAPEVGQLQKYLIKEFGAKISPSGEVDNHWHNMTEDAVQKFLQRNNVSASIYYKFKMDKY